MCNPPFRRSDRRTLSIGLLAALLAGATPSPANADVLANWTFESSVPTTFGPHVAEGGLFAATSTTVISHRDILAAYSSPAGNGSAHSFNSSWWLIQDSYLFYTRTTGFDSITISFDQTRSSTGPSPFNLDVSLDGVNWTNIASYTVPQVAWSSAAPQAASVFGPFSAPSLANDQSIVIFRMIATAAGSTTAGTNRMDNILISASPVPEPGSATGMLALCALARRIIPRESACRAKTRG